MTGYPKQGISFIVGSPVGGGVDRITRIFAAKLAPRLGQAVTIDNVTGTSAMIGSAKAARAAPDGYTLLMASAQFSVLPCMYASMPYDTLNDFVPLAQVATAPLILVTPPTLLAATLREFIQLAKERELTYANAGNGGAPHLAAESFSMDAGIRMRGVLYEGIVPAIADLVLGKVDTLFASLPSVIDPIRQGRLKALGVTTTSRSPVFPEVPTIAEAGLPGYEYGAWFAAFGPAKLPAEVVTRLRAELGAILRLPETRAELEKVGYQPSGIAPDDFDAYFKSEMRRWSKVVAAAGITAI